jgi:hypothetical protein
MSEESKEIRQQSPEGSLGELLKVGDVGATVKTAL